MFKKKRKENQDIIVGRQLQKVRKEDVCYKLTERERKTGSEVNRKKMRHKARQAGV